MKLRDYQIRTVVECRAQYRAGSRAICIVIATGGGKTKTAVAILSEVVNRDGRALWIVHRRELIEQAAADLRAAGLETTILAPWAAYDASAHVTVASIQTLIARDILPPCDVMVWDECHHAVAESYARVADHYKGVLRLGLTATPQRTDGVGLGNVFQSMVVSGTPHDLTRDGWLVPCTVMGPPKRSRQLADNPVDAYRVLGQGRKAIVFGASVKHAQDLALQFRAAGISAACVDGAMSDDDRRDVMRGFKHGRYRVLTNMHILTEGFDDPEVSCSVLARQFGSESTYLQSVGRILRLFPGKTDAIVIDLCGAALEHGLPTDKREYSLEGRGIKSAAGLEPLTQCAACGMVFRAALFVDATCPSCGQVRKGKQDPAVRRQIMAAIAEKEPDTARIEYLKKQVGMCRANGWKLGRALKMFQIKYRYWPNDAMKAAAGWYAGGR